VNFKGVYFASQIVAKEMIPKGAEKSLTLPLLLAIWRDQELLFRFMQERKQE